MALEGRQVDLSVFSEPNVQGRQQALDFPDPPLLVAGPLKAAQQWVVLFLTQKGSVVGDSDFGTSFMAQAIAGYLTNDTTILQAFSQAQLEANDYIANQLTGAEPDDEVVVRADLLDGWGFSGDRTRLELSIQITTRAGTNRQILAAVPMN